MGAVVQQAVSEHQATVGASAMANLRMVERIETEKRA